MTDKIKVEKASPVELRKSMQAAQAMLNAGIAFVPVPALSRDDAVELQQMATQRIDAIMAEVESRCTKH